MEIVFKLIFVVIALGSVITTYVAIFQILTNDFNGSKVKWIFICLIGFIGPIMYLTQGRKLIIKRDKKLFDKDEITSLKKFYIDLMAGLNINIKVFLAISICLIIFGYVVRIADLYFFWESKQIGFVFVLVSLAIILRKDIATRKKLKLKTIFSHIGFWAITFVLFMKVIMFVILLNCDAYDAVKVYIKGDNELKAEIGDHVSHTLLPGGSIQTITDMHGTTGFAVIKLIIKGENKFKEQTIHLLKTSDKDWQVVVIE